MTRAMPARIGKLYWVATSGLLLAGLTVAPAGLVGAAALTAVQCLHYIARGYCIAELALQVRLAYLALLVAGFWPPLAALHVLLWLGVTATVAVDYCLLARLLSLAPWNLRQPLCWPLLRWTLFTPPRPGSIVARRASSAWC